MARSLMICANANKELCLNESENLPGKKYILEGIFAELDTLNRNQRIYTKEEYLKHLQYLRADIKKGEPLLGELDHPDDRFEVKMKEASHRVIDLWYDPNKNVVMGKIELLNTPNGKLAQSIVDQGIPLHISSRAAGTVNNDNTVSIQQIYTYDLVCKPGFAKCVLYRVAESVDTQSYTDDVKGFLSRMLKTESLNSAPQYGVVNENVSVAEMRATATLRKEAKEIQINKQMELNEDMSKPLFENTNPDSTVGKPLNISGGGAAALGIPTADMGGTNETADEDKEKPATSGNSSEDKSKNEDKEEKCKKCGKSPCECKESEEDGNQSSEPAANEAEEEDSNKSNGSDGNASAGNQSATNEADDEEEDKDDKDDEESNDSDNAEGDEDKDEESSDDKGVEILDVEPEFEDSDDDKDDGMIKDVEADHGEDEGKSDDDSEGDGDEDETSESEETDKDAVDEDDKNAKEAEKLSDTAVKDIEKHKDSIFKKLDDLQAAIEKKNREKKESKNESIIMARYPVSMQMTESNFAKFASLTESQKNKVMNYLNDKQMTSPKMINENWQNGINYVSPEPVWLRLAPKHYRDLYESATQQVKDNLAINAKYILFENQNDINIFWENSGLEEANERKLLNESFVNNMPKVAAKVENVSLPYGKEFIQQIADMASEYNTHRY